MVDTHSEARSRNKSCRLQNYNHFLSVNLGRKAPAPNTGPPDWDPLSKYATWQSLPSVLLDFSVCHATWSLKVLASGSRTEVRAPHCAACPHFLGPL